MRGLRRYVNGNILLKVAGLNSIQVLLRIGTGVVMSKIIAIFLGTSGLAVLGNFRNFFQGLQSFCLLGFENGLVRYAAQYKEQKQQLQQLFTAAWTVTLLLTIGLSIGIYFTASFLDTYLIGLERSYNFVFKALAVTLPFYVLFAMISSLLQGLQRYRSFIWLNIIINVMVFAMSATLIYNHSITGAFAAIVITPLVQCIAALGIWWRASAPGFNIRSLIQWNLNITDVRPLWGYSGMALLSAVLVPVTFIAVRQDLRIVMGDDAAGNWEGLQRLSHYYMIFVTTLISLYVLPQLSKNESARNYRTTILHFYKTILPPLAMGLIALYLCRELIVTYLYTQEFKGMLPLFKWQFAGDFVKIITTVLAFRFIAISDFKRYAIAEIISLSAFYLTSYFLIRLYGTSGVVMAHLASHLIFLFVLIILLRRELFH